MDLNGQKIQVGTAGSPLHSWGGGQQTKAVWPKGLSWWIIHFFPDTIEPWETPCWLVVLEDCTYYLVQLGLWNNPYEWGNHQPTTILSEMEKNEAIFMAQFQLIFFLAESHQDQVFFCFFLHRPLSGIGRWWSDFGGTGTCGGSTTGNCLVLVGSDFPGIALDWLHLAYWRDRTMAGLRNQQGLGKASS